MKQWMVMQRQANRPHSGLQKAPAKKWTEQQEELDAEANDQIHTGSDHRCVMALFVFPATKKRLSNQNRTKK